MRSPVGPHRAELGDTDDPTALVPGDPGALFACAQQYRDAASGCERAANELAGLCQVDGWEGESAGAFAQRVTNMVTAWDDLAEKMGAAAGAWEQYATVLGWGQQKAGDAIAMFAHAAALTAAAAAEAPAPLGPRGDTGPGTRAFPDPGSGPRSDARALLAYARESVDGGNPHGRYFDGLFRNPDGTYSALEVKSGTGGLTREQRLFDGLTNGGSPARAILNGQENSIVRVFTRTVD